MRFTDLRSHLKSEFKKNSSPDAYFSETRAFHSRVDRQTIRFVSETLPHHSKGKLLHIQSYKYRKGEIEIALQASTRVTRARADRQQELHASSMPSHGKPAGAHVRLFPRRKLIGGEIPEKGRAPLKVDMSAIQALFCRPQSDAAKEIGISLTALKQICRKLGIQRWPYQRLCKSGRKYAKPASAADTPPSARSPTSSVAEPHRVASNRNADDDHVSESEASTADAESADDEPSGNVDASSAADTPPSAAALGGASAFCHSRNASYYCHQAGDACEPVSLQLHELESFTKPFMDAKDDEGDDLAWMAVELPDHELNYDSNWQNYFYAVARAPVQQPRVYERCEATPLFSPGGASEEFSRACGDALKEALSAQATAQNSPVFRPTASLFRGSPLHGVDARHFATRPSKVHSDDPALSALVAPTVFAR
jgi:hypothetical protein